MSHTGKDTSKDTGKETGTGRAGESLREGMAEATRLTTTGRLAEATAAIQRTLRGAPAVDASPAGPERAAEPIEAAFRVVDGPAAPAAAAPIVAPGEPPRGARRPPMFARGGAGRPGLLTPDRAPATAESGGQFVTGSYTNRAGTRAYKLYIPRGYREQAVPLIVMLHGCTQSPDDFAAGTRMNAFAETHNFLVAYPQQATSANGSKCWNWFKAADQSRDRGEPSIIAGITQQVMATYQVEAERVYVAGMSAGGAMAAIMGTTYPDLYAAIGVHSGLAYGAARDLASALQAQASGAPDPARVGGRAAAAAGPLARVVPTIVFHGDRDGTVNKINGDQVLDQSVTTDAGGRDNRGGSDRRATVSQGRVAGGHAYTRSVYHDAGDRAIMEKWIVHQAGHAWSGGSPGGSYTDPKGPDASAEMVRFFGEHPRG